MKQLDNMWLRKINNNGSEFRYELETFFSAPLMLDNGSQTQMFVLYKYWKNNDGEFLLCRSNEKVYVTIETLLSLFVSIDSPVDKLLIILEAFKRDTQAKNLEDSLKPFVFNDVKESNAEHLDSENLDTPINISNLDNIDL